MTAKEFLSQAYRLDKMIDWKIQQIESLNALATRASTTMSGMPHAPNHSTSRLADVIVKIVDMQEAINAEIDRLVDIKAEISGVIRKVENEEYRCLLELRYLCYKEWDTIAQEMNYSLRWTYTIHGRALAVVDRALDQ